VSHKVEIGHLQECAHRCRFIVLPCGPTAHLGQGRQDCSVGFEKKTVATVCGLACKFISTCLDFIANLLRAKNQPFRI
jgi:hypothetical protein